MGQKVNPHGARVGVIFGWSTRWYADKKDFANNLVEDFKLRKMIKEKYYAAGISRIDIERTAKDVTVNIMTSKPGMIIGPKGATIEQLKAEVTKQLGRPAQINVMEIKQPDADAQLVAENIAQQLEKRISFRRALKQAQQRAGAKGIRVQCSGRLGGAEMSRSEFYREGRVPLQTLRANIDYGFFEARTTFGRIGVKVWIYKGDMTEREFARAQAEQANRGGGRRGDRRGGPGRRGGRDGGAGRTPRTGGQGTEAADQAPATADADLQAPVAETATEA